MPKTFIGVRDVDEETFRKFRARAIARRMALGTALTQAMRNALRETREKNLKENLEKVKKAFTIKPLNFGPGNERLSAQADEILYGWKK